MSPLRSAPVLTDLSKPEEIAALNRFLRELQEFTQTLGVVAPEHAKQREPKENEIFIEAGTGKLLLYHDGVYREIV